MIFERLNQFRNNIAFIEKNNTCNYSDIIEYGIKFADKFYTKNILCLIVTGNNAATVISYLSAVEHNIPALLVNKPKKNTELLSIINNYKPKYIFLSTQDSFDENIKNITSKQIYSIFDYSLIETIYDTDYDIHPDLSILLTTSGSTGTNKYVRLSKKNILSNAQSIIQYLNILENDRVITTLPFSYSYGLSIINTHILSGASIVLSEYSIIQREFWQLLSATNATTFGGVPYTYEMMQRLKFERMNIPNISYITQAGGRLNTNLTQYFLEECSKKNIQFFKMYGQTEATARISYLEPKYLYEKTDSIGKAIPDGELFVVDENNNYLSSNKTGELIYKGSNVCMGYAESCYDLHTGDENNGILHTGDIGYYDKDGFFYIAGRKKRFLKVFGNRINLDELENKLNINGCLCACSGVDDKIKIYVCSEDMKNKAALLLKDTLDIHPSGYSIEIIKEIPRNSAGKIQYSLLG